MPEAAVQKMLNDNALETYPRLRDGAIYGKSAQASVEKAQ
jgi:hypothetical protein